MRVPGRQRKSYAWRWTAALAGLAVLAVFVAGWLAREPEQHPAQAATFTVNVLTDDADLAIDGTCDSSAASGNQCSLRAAIEEANANAVTDTISFGSLSGTITLGAGLPTLAAAQGTTIDGNGNVTVDGGGVVCFTVTSASNTIRDLLITNCTRAVLITGEAADGNAVRGNTIYSNTPGGGAGAVEIAAGADSNVVGGTTAADRNIIRDNTGNGVYVTAATSTGNVISGNCIGTTSSCSVAAPNSIDGVAIAGGALSTTVGGTGSGAANTIAFNGGDGVDLTAAGVTDNIVTRNATFLNSGQGINSAVLPEATLLAGCADAGGGNVACSGSAPVAGPGTIVDVYRASVEGADVEGDLFLCTAVAGGGGAWGCTFPNPGGGSATATQRLAPANTSEFSAAVGIPAGPVITPTPTPTDTPTITPTATGTPPTATATVTPTGTPPTSTPTRTPTVVAMESVTLVGGTCNPVASTYADNTPIATIADAVSPSGILISIWNFDAGVWLGYSPQFPSVSDLTDIDRLDAFFLCVSSAGTWSRPVIG
jgi:hypothetical protein